MKAIIEAIERWNPLDERENKAKSEANKIPL